MKEQVFMNDYGILGHHKDGFRVAKDDKIFKKRYKTLTEATKALHKKMSKKDNLLKYIEDIKI